MRGSSTFGASEGRDDFAFAFPNTKRLNHMGNLKGPWGATSGWEGWAEGRKNWARIWPAEPWTWLAFTVRKGVGGGEEPYPSKAVKGKGPAGGGLAPGQKPLHDNTGKVKEAGSKRGGGGTKVAIAYADYEEREFSNGD